MKFKIGERIYNLGFLMGSAEEEWQLRFTETEGLVFSTLNEREVLGAHGDPTGEKCCVWEDTFTVATGEDAKALWAALTRVLAAEKLCLDVGEFLAHVEEHDMMVQVGREAGREEQRIRRMSLEETLAETRGLTLDQIRGAQMGQGKQTGPIPMILPPGGKGGFN